MNARLPAGTDLSVTILQGSVRYDNERLVRLAPEYGADPEVRDIWHQRPVDIAFRRGFKGLVHILREVSLPLDMYVEPDLETGWRDASSTRASQPRFGLPI